MKAKDFTVETKYFTVSLKCITVGFWVNREAHFESLKLCLLLHSNVRRGSWVLYYLEPSNFPNLLKKYDFTEGVNYLKRVAIPQT